MSAALEARYRAALRWYPRAWRAENADAIVGTMLDQADAAGRSTPLPGELRNLASSGMSRRFERIAPQVVRDRVAAVALGIGTAYALIMLVASEWAPLATSGPFNQWMSSNPGEYRAPSTIGFGPFASVMVLEYGLWILAFVLVMLGWSRSAVVVLLLTVPLLAVIRSLRTDEIAVLQPTTFALVVVALVAVLATVGRPARLRRRTVVALPIATAAVAVGFLVVSGDPSLFAGRLSTVGGTMGVLNAPLFGGLLVLGSVVLAVRRQRAWAVAAVVSAAPWLGVTTLIFFPLVIGIPLGGLVILICLAIAGAVWKASRAGRTSALS